MTPEQIDEVLDLGPFTTGDGSYGLRMVWTAWEESRSHCMGVPDSTSRERFRTWLFGPMASTPSRPEPSIDALIERSSLGTPHAKTVRASADPAQVERVMERVRQLEKRALERLKRMLIEGQPADA